MRRSIRAIVFNSDESFAAPLRAQLLSIHGLHVVAAVDDAGMLGVTVAQFPCDVLIAHIDPDPTANLALLAPLTAEHPEIPFFVISSSSDGQLILNALRAGVREYLTKPLDPAQLTAAIDRVAQQAAGKAEPARILTIMNSTGGCGSSTIAVNLAVELAALGAAEGRRVVLVDLDYKFGQVATMLDLQPKYTIADLCDSPEQVDPQLISQALIEHSSGVRVLARPTHFGQAESITAAHCVGVLTGLQDMCDYIVVDGPTRFDPGAKAVLDLASTQLIVAQFTVPSVRNVHRMLEAFEAHGYSRERIRIVCNRVPKDSGLLEQEHVESSLGTSIFMTLPDDWKTVCTAVNEGRPLAESAAKSKVRQAFMELAQRLYEPAGSNGRGDSGRANGEALGGNPRRSGGLLEKFFG